MANDLSQSITEAAFCFRGYNVTNLGRTRELLECPAYRPTVESYLQRAGDVCARWSGRPVDLLGIVCKGEEPRLDRYAEALALVMGIELAQIELLNTIHGIPFKKAKLTFGYSLGELSAVVAAGVFSLEDVLSVPVAMADDSAALAHNVLMGVLFSRGRELPEDKVLRLCRRITSEGRGVIGVSSVLSPNSYLLLGQNGTVARFKELAPELLPESVHVRINDNHWPPLHTPIVWQKSIVDRASVMMQALEGKFHPACPPIVSLVTGKRSYDEDHSLAILRRWIDQPQRLWDAVCDTLSSGAKTVIHVGPEPNVIPATFRRLSENVQQQTKGNSLGSLSWRAAAGLVERRWLSSLLPSRAALLRAPALRHIILEDWLLEHAPAVVGSSGS